jgi:predicted dehydrogenase
MRNEKINLAVIGCGYWGPNLVRNFAELSNVNVYALCDLDISRAKAVAQDYAPNALVVSDYYSILDDPEIHGVVVATPIETHFQIAQDVLSAGKNIFVEKPLAKSAEECQKLIELAKKQGLILMVGHVFQYNTAVRKIKEYIDLGFLGRILYIHSRRLNLGRIQTNMNALWSFAPHDISILLYWLNSNPLSVTCRGFSYLNPGIEDVVFMTMEFPRGIEAHCHLSWLDPKKVREMVIVGSDRMLVYDDVSVEGKIRIYNKSIIAKEKVSFNYEKSYAEFQTKSRYGDVVIPYFPFSEPLQLECEHFVDCIRTGNHPLSDGQAGLSVVCALEAASKSLKLGGITQGVVKDELTIPV